jgi:hypothetical protein
MVSSDNSHYRKGLDLEDRVLMEGDLRDPHPFHPVRHSKKSAVCKPAESLSRR